MDKNQEDKNKKYLDSLFDDENQQPQEKQQQLNFDNQNTQEVYDDHVSDLHYLNVDIDMLPAGRFYKSGTKIKIRAAKVYEIQAYSVVDDNNFLDITDKMNELLSRNVIFIFPNGTKGSYRDVKDADRMFLIFMIREMTFQGGNTLTKEVKCNECKHSFEIPFRATTGKSGKATFEQHQPSDKIARFFNASECAYEFVHKDVSWKLAPPTIGMQEALYEEIKRNVQKDEKPDIAFMKTIPFLLYDRSSITEEGIKAKYDDFKSMDDMKLAQMIKTLIDNMTLGVKGLKMECPECGAEVRTDLTFPNGASTLFDIPNILDEF